MLLNTHHFTHEPISHNILAHPSKGHSPILDTAYLSDFTPEGLQTLRTTFNFTDPAITLDAVAFVALKSLSDAAKSLAKYHCERNELRAALDVAERDVQHQQQSIDSLNTAVDALKTAALIKDNSSITNAPVHIIDLIVRLLDNQRKLDATDPDTLEDGLAAIHSLIHSHDDLYPHLGKSRSLLLAATQCFSSQLRSWHDNLPIDHVARKSWPELKSHILARFPPGDAQQRAHHKLFECRCDSGADWYRFTIEVQAYAKKAKVDDAVVIGHIKTTPGVVPAELSSLLTGLLGAGKTLEEWLATATALFSESKLLLAPAPLPTPTADPVQVNTIRVNPEDQDPTPNLICRTLADARDRSRAVYKGKLRHHFHEYRKQHNLCMACGYPPGQHAETCPAQRQAGNV
ncbi:hypothetical protein BCR44DRAFT_23955 [Catenaria anguillulae PL171]|uniref:Retrotransposon gag domain-containing protein n=1 Tax=Catenaria anguillulae PL171 TaxID=765915 RepID=A0A1Y2H5J5_9FUNG|nr:hypothetical protein BCR44DRAFT_23955 [Catenaria anguillulae PL171]